MTATAIEYLDMNGVLRRITLPRFITPRETERLQEYLQNTELGSRNLFKSLSQTSIQFLQAHSDPTEKILGGPYDGLRPEEAEFLQDLGWREMWLEEETSTVSDLTAEEATSLQNLGWLNNNLSSLEEAFLRENGLAEANLPASSVAPTYSESLSSPSPSSSPPPSSPPSPSRSPSSKTHAPGCPCKYPWTCNPRPEPPRIPRHDLASDAQPAPGSLAVSPPMPSDKKEVRQDPPSSALELWTIALPA